MSGAQTVSMGSKISTNLTWAWDSTKAGVLGVCRPVHSAISGPGVNAINAVWTRCGTYGGALVVVLGTVTVAYLGNKAWHQKDEAGEKKSLTTLFLNVLGLGMLVGAGAATIAGVGAATGNVGYVAYGAGTLLTAFALTVPFDRENEEEEGGSGIPKRRSRPIDGGNPEPTVGKKNLADVDGADTDDSGDDDTKEL